MMLMVTEIVESSLIITQVLFRAFTLASTRKEASGRGLSSVVNLGAPKQYA